MNGKYLTEKDNVEHSEYLEHLYNISTDNVKSITFIVTEDCPLACTYCYEKHKSNKKMSFDVVRKGIDLIFDNEKLNGYYDINNIDGFIIDFIGGEPFVAIDVIDYATEYFKQKAYSVNESIYYNSKFSISSNGVLYRTPEVQDYVRKNFGKLSLGISLDGNKQLHDSCRVFKDGRGSYDLAADALKDVVSKNEYATTKMTLSPDNIIYTFEAIKSLYEDIGLHFVNANCVFESGWTDEHAKIFYDELIKLADWIIDNKLYDKFYCSLFRSDLGGVNTEMDKNYCGGNGQMLAIGADGDCYPCLRYAPISLTKRPPLVIGNVNDGLLTNIDEMNICEHLCGITMISQSPQKCLDCKVSGGCGLCSGFNYDEFGDANVRATYICEMHKMRVKANEYFWTKLREVVT
jgi:uncharacterized protein